MLGVAITLPAPRPVGNGLLAVARSLDDPSWVRGVQVNSSTCLTGLPFPYCNDPDSQTDKDTQRPSTVETFEPTGITVSVDCSTLGGDPQKFAEQGLDVVREYELGLELATGVTTANPSLADATALPGGGTGYAPALALLEQYMAQSLMGRLGFIHVTPADFVMLVSDDLVRLDGNTWRSPGGHVVVASPGYDFDGVLHATGEVFAEVGGRATLNSVDRNVNTRFVTAEELGIVVFDPCFNISVTVVGAVESSA